MSYLHHLGPNFLFCFHKFSQSQFIISSDRAAGDCLYNMALNNPLFDDIRSKSDVDPPQNEESIDVGELVNDPAQTALKSNGNVSSSVRELLECPVCLSAMYPPIHQVVHVSMMVLLLIFWFIWNFS